jgi:hypothetical protein
MSITTFNPRRSEVDIKRFMSKKVVAVGLAAGITLGLGGAAFAYFTAAGSGSADAAVGNTGTWGISQVGPAAGAMYPGQGSSAVSYTITNDGSGNQALTGLQASIPAMNGDVLSGGNEVVGCLASWFTPTVGTPSVAIGSSITPGKTANVTVTVTMADASVSQDSCVDVSPEVSLAASA